MRLNDPARTRYQPPVTTTNPPTADIDPVEPVVRDFYGFPIVQGRREVSVAPKSPPLPVPYSAFAGVGRDPAHATPRVDTVQSLAMAEWLGVIGWPFKFPKVTSALVTITGRGVPSQAPIRARFNVEPGVPTSLGSRATYRGAATVVAQGELLGATNPLAKIG